MSSLTDQLKIGTAGLHAEMEALPFFRALADGSLPLDSYLSRPLLFKGRDRVGMGIGWQRTNR